MLFLIHLGVDFSLAVGKSTYPLRLIKFFDYYGKASCRDSSMSYPIAEKIRRYVLGLEPLNPPQTLRPPCLCLRTNVASPGKKPVAQPKLIA